MVFGVLLRFGFEGAGVRADAHPRRPVALRLGSGNKVAGLAGMDPGRSATEGIFPVDALVGCWLNPRGGCSCSPRLTPPHAPSPSFAIWAQRPGTLPYAGEQQTTLGLGVVVVDKVEGRVRKSVADEVREEVVVQGREELKPDLDRVEEEWNRIRSGD